MRKTLLCLTCIVMLLTPLCGQAGPANPGVISFTEEATGNTVQIRNYGDEFFSYMADLSGQILVVDESGYLRYVVAEKNAYALGGYVTGQRAASNGAEQHAMVGAEGLQDKLSALMMGMTSSGMQQKSGGSRIGDIPDDYKFVGDAAQNRVQVCTDAEEMWLADVGNYPQMQPMCDLLVLRVNFTNVQGVFSDSEWHDRIFEDGGVSEYYDTVSNGVFTYMPATETSGTPDDGVVTVTLPFDCPPYTYPNATNQLTDSGVRDGLYVGTNGMNYAIYNKASIFAYAALAAEKVVDFGAYDRNKDGYISPTELGILVVVAGYEVSFCGAALAEGKPAAWAHSWWYNNLTRATTAPHLMTITVGGKKLSKYTMIAELHNTPSTYDIFSGTGTPNQAPIGTATHELGHDIGLRDLYPTGATRPELQVGILSLMAGGSWGKVEGGQTGGMPTHIDPYDKIYLGFYQSSTISADGKYTLYATEPSNRYNILRINTSNPDVYYLLENRQFTGFDSGMWYRLSKYPEGGTVIWRIDEAVIRATWDANTINNTSGKYGIMPVYTVQDDGTSSPFWSVNSDENALAALHQLIQPNFVTAPGSSMDFYLGAVPTATPPVTTAPTATPTTAPTATAAPTPTVTPTAAPTRTPVPTNTTAPTGSPLPNPPQTGDESTLLLWGILLVVSLAGIIVVCLHFRRKK